MALVEVRAQDSTAFFILTKEDMVTNNVTNLEEALNVPLLYQYFIDNQTITRSVGLDINELAIYKDGFPLIMDHNVGYDLRTIPTWDLDRIEVHLSPHSAMVKNSSGIVIHLYTTILQDRPLSANAFVINTSASDFHVGASLGLSNKRHEGRVGINRSFVSPTYANSGDRGTLISASERYDANFLYRFNILRTVKLTVGSENSRLRTQNRGKIFEGTARVRDQEVLTSRNNLSVKLATELSKNHTVELASLLHRYKNEPVWVDKNLSTGKQEQVVMPNDARGYDQGYLSLLLRSRNQKFNYTLGLEINNVSDNQFENINAITPAYSDYSAIGLFEYQFRETFKLEGGLKLLTNSLTESYFLPSGKITLAPRNDLQLIASHQQSVAYPLFSQVFYPIEISGDRNNLILNPVNLRTTNVKVRVTKKSIDVQSGMMLISKNNDHRILPNLSVVNVGNSRSTTTYFSGKVKTEWLNWRPTMMLHGMNTARDTNSLTFFYPEVNSYLQVKIPKTRLAFGWVYRYVGERKYMDATDRVVMLKEEDKYTTGSFSVSSTFLKEALTIHFGINNLNSNESVDHRQYQFNDILPILIDQETVLVNRVRTFFFNLQFKIK